MLWLVMKDDSHEIIACNICERDEKFELWVTRPTGKSLKITESENKDDISVVKEAIDYAIENKEHALRLL